jgi:predicted HicB family RNase H-like nuclease
MKISQLEYKGYVGTIEADQEHDILFGKLAFMRDVVTYEATTVKKLASAFETAVDEYLTKCALASKKPDKPFKGSFNIRTGPDLHRRAALASQETSLNAFVCEAIKEKLERESLKKKSLQNSFTKVYQKQRA